MIGHGIADKIVQFLYAMQTTKLCAKCGEVKPATSEYFQIKRDAEHPNYCMPCQIAYSKQGKKLKVARYEDCFVYFVEAVGSNCIKIGSSAHVNLRLKDLQVACPFEMRLLKQVACSTEFTESVVHNQFTHLRQRGEWFSATQELRDYIKNLHDVGENSIIIDRLFAHDSNHSILRLLNATPVAQTPDT